MCAQALDSKITTIAPWRDPEFLEKFKVRAPLELAVLAPSIMLQVLLMLLVLRYGAGPAAVVAYSSG